MRPLLSWYTSTFEHWVATGVGMVVLMLVVGRLLRACGVGREAAAGYALILPWLLGFVIWQVYPLLSSLYLMFTDYNLLQPPHWIGLANFKRMLFDDPNFWRAMRLTLPYAFISVPLGMLGATLTATLLAADVRGAGFWRTLYYVPAVLPAAATALLWRWLFAGDGLVNFLMSPVYRLLHLDKPLWFADQRLVLPSFIIMSLWGVFGANTVILLAGLKSVPRSLYEAAEVDGAGALVKFRRITLPMLSPSLFYVLIMGIIAAMQVFTAPLFISTPGGAGTFINVYIYSEAFGRFRMGYASALGWVLLLIILLLTLAVFRSSPAWVHYEGEKRGA